MFVQEVRHYEGSFGSKRVATPDARVMCGALELVQDAIVDAKAVMAVLDPVERPPEKLVSGDRQSVGRIHRAKMLAGLERSLGQVWYPTCCSQCKRGCSPETRDRDCDSWVGSFAEDTVPVSPDMR